MSLEPMIGGKADKGHLMGSGMELSSIDPLMGCIIVCVLCSEFFFDFVFSKYCLHAEKLNGTPMVKAC